MPETNAEILRSVGALQEAVKNLTTVAIRMDDKFAEERHEIYDRIEDVAEDIKNLTARVEVLQSKMSDIAPTIELFEESYQRSIGAKHLGKFIWGALISVLTVAIAAASALWNIFSHHITQVPGLH